MAPSSSPVTAPTEKIRIVRQARPADADIPDLTLHLDAGLPSPGAPGPFDPPLMLKQRIAHDRSELRRLRRSLPDLADRGGRADLQARFEIESAMRTLRAGIREGDRALDHLVETGRTRRWGPSDFEPGDQARYRSAWYQVLAVGPAGLTVRFRRTGGGTWDAPAEYARLTGRRRNGVEETDAA